MSTRSRVSVLSALAILALAVAIAAVVVGSPYVAMVALAGLIVAISCQRKLLSALAIVRTG